MQVQVQKIEPNPRPALTHTYVRFRRYVCDLDKVLRETEQFEDMPSTCPDHHARANFLEASSSLINVNLNV
jgi:hypothetical protein